MTKILGLDLGTNSIGWAITEKEDSTFNLLDKGVDIFQEGVTRTKSGEKPTVKNRTDARALRRHYFRRRLRKIELLKVLVEKDMCPYISPEELDGWRYQKRYPTSEEFLAWQRTNDKKGKNKGKNKNPYLDRYIAITEELDLTVRSNRHLLGRAFYHLAQRRGFLSNRKDNSSSEDGDVKGAINQLSIDMKASGCDHLGQFYYKLYVDGKKIRTGDGYGYAGRIIHYEKEFDAICEKQKLPNELRTALHRAIFFQRPLKSQKGLVGSCTFEKGKSRCPISHPRFEEFRMLAFINNIRVQGPRDEEPRQLTNEEISLIKPLFHRKSREKEYFDFEEIAKKIAGGKKGCYGHTSDKTDVAYRFNYKMSQTVAGNPVTAALKGLFGEDWLTTMCSLYTKSENKNEEKILNDVWHVLFSFNDDDKLATWAKENLQLNDEQVKTFVKIRIKQGYASLSLSAINKILPWLRARYRYDEAVFIANLHKVVPPEVWRNEAKRQQIVNSVADAVSNFVSTKQGETKENAIFSTLLDCGLYGNELRIDRLYHPSKVESYKDAMPNSEGLCLLASPRTSSVRNPMAMRALFRLRALVNQLLKEDKINTKTKINIEFARRLNDANKRAAIERYQDENEKMHQKYADNIRKLYKAETNCDVEPTEDDILKYQLWEEQNHYCLYTGNQIAISKFIGADPEYDIEHTVPLSKGGDNSQMNKTLCYSDFNRRIKRENLPSQLANHSEVMERIETLGWKRDIERLEYQIENWNRTAKKATSKEAKDNAILNRHYLRIRLDYLRGKLLRFTMNEVPQGFSNRQGVDIGIIGKYAKMYLETVFDKVYTVKGITTAEFRKMWGLQDEYSKKERANHVHHCIDAITIACIDKGTYDKWAHFQRDTEQYTWNGGNRPIMEKPWSTFTEDVKAIAEELIISHHTANNLPKHSRKKLRVRGKIQYNADGKAKYMQGDTARGVLHQQTFYGAINRDEEVKYVERKPLGKLRESDVDKIVDDAVRECIQKAIANKGFKEAMSTPILFNEDKGVYIKKVRIYATRITNPLHIKKHRDVSRHEYKQEYLVANDSNYCMAIYEGKENCKIKRTFELVNNLDATKYYNGKSGLGEIVPLQKNHLPLRCILRTGTMVLFYESSPKELLECSNSGLVKRLYKIIGMSTMLIQRKYMYGMITLRHHQEARPAGELKAKNGEWKIGEQYRPTIIINHNQFNAIVEGYDFELSVTGEIKFKHSF